MRSFEEGFKLIQEAHGLPDVPTEWDVSMPSRGLGDTIAKFTHATGIDRFVKAATKAVGIKDCGCRKRQDAMNTRVPYRKECVALLGEIGRDSWVTTALMAEHTLRMCGYLPGDIDAVVGVARSGMIPAGIVAANLHVPLYATSASHDHAPTKLVDTGMGWRMVTTPPRGSVRKVLIVDDTSANGFGSRRIRPYIQSRWPEAEVLMAVVYSTRRAMQFIDIAAVIYDGPHYLEWNLFNSGNAEAMGTDMDGILCEECPAECDDDGEKYLSWMSSVRPIHRPVRRPLPLIVTARLERYRQETEAWLGKYGIKFDKLIMGPWRSREVRNERWPEKVVQVKANAIRAAKVRLFVESDPNQAAAIQLAIKRPVLCPAIGRVL